MFNEEINELFYSLQNQLVAYTTQREPIWEDISVRQAQASMSQQHSGWGTYDNFSYVSQQAYNFERGNYFNNNAGYFSQPHNKIQSYYFLGWGTYDNFFYGNPSMQNQESSSSYYQEQIRKLSNEELFLALKKEIKKDKDALEMRWPNKETNMEANMETMMDANLIANIETNYINNSKEMCVVMDRIAI